MRPPSGRPANVEDVYPLSPMQQGMLFHSLLSPREDPYFDRLTCTLEGDLDAAAFRRAWQAVVDRHAILRTCFVWEGIREPVQMVCRKVPLDWTEEDWRDLPADERERRWGSFLEEDRRRGIALGTPPLMRFTLCRTAGGEYRFAWTHHHVLLDGWSLPLLMAELLACYRAFAAGGEPRLPRPRPYRDFIAWLRRRDPAEAETFWRGELAGFDEPSLIAGPGRPGGEEKGFGQVHATVSSEDLERLRAIAAQYRLTLNTLLQGAWAVVLGRRTGRDDVLFGSVVSGRPAELPEVEHVVGLFINTIPVRAQVSGHGPVHAFLAHLQRRQAEARQYEHTPLVEVRGWSAVPRDSPLFDSLLVLENYPVPRGAWAPGEGALRVRGVEDEERTSYPLCISAVAGSRLGLRTSWDHGLGAAEVERIVRQLQAVLAGIAAAPEGPLSGLSLLEEAERRQVLVDWNRTRRAWPEEEACLHELFAAMARRQPESPAVVSGGEVLTFGEVERRAGRLAHRLRRSGVGPESLVGLCLERSPEMIVALLGVLAAGGAYVPLEPGHPAERLAGMIEDAGVSLVLTREELRLEDEAIANEPEEWPASGVVPENAAYVIFTSGSNGRPKGVVISHRSLCNYARWAADAYAVGGRTGSCVHTPLTFDLTVTSLWVPLLNGVPIDLLPAPDGLAREIAGTGFGFLKLTPAHLELLRDERERLAATPLTLVVGGEALLGAAVREWLGREVETRIFNEYGPTEATVGCCVEEIGPGVGDGPLPIGRPIANTRAYVVDGGGEPLPVEVPGELWIGGAGLARGYARRPDLTAERFIPDPFGSEAGARLYRTGDRARWREDGTLEYLGRADEQVKIRGYRIEPGEVKAALEACPGVDAAAVVAREDRPGQKRLVAYVVGPGAADAEALRDRLRRTLPGFMLPAIFVPLEALPLTAHGKLDRKALPAPGEREAGEVEQASWTPVQELLAGVWSEVLGCGAVGLDDDFFALGGHSLLATQMVSRARRVLGVELELRQMLDAPTLRGMARRIEALRAERSGSPDPAPIERAVPGTDAPLSPAQERLWFLERLRPGSRAFHVPALVRLRGRLDAAALGRSLDGIVRRHEVLRTRIVEAGGEEVQRVDPPRSGVLDLVDLTGLPEERREREALARAREVADQPFDLARGPLIRAVLLRLGEPDHLLGLTLHHIVSDGWSMGVLVREIPELYAADVQGRPPRLPELPLQYRDYAVWQRDRMASGEMARQLDRWRERLRDLPPLELPTDRPRPKAVSDRGAAERLVLGAAAAERLRAVCRREGVTLFMALTAVWRTVLWRWSGQRDLALGTPVANRDRLELEGLIGLFVNTLALRSELRSGDSFRDLLRRARETALEAYALQEVPFERVVEAVAPGRDLSRTPLFQAFLLVEHARRRPVGGPIPELELARVEAVPRTAQFELSLLLEDDPEAGVGGWLVYSADLFDGATARRMLGHLERVLEQAAEWPERRLRELDLLGEEERRQVLEEWNRAESPRPDRCLHELFEEQAGRSPAAVAVVSRSGEVSYGELDRRASRLACHLARLGVGIETRVALCLERGVDLVVAILGTLKAGGAYVPLDPELPIERLAWLLKDSKAVVAVTSGGLRELLGPWGAPVVCLDRESGEPALEPVVEVDPGNAAYVIYTSGSTGRPKGVVVEHGSAVNLALAQIEAFGIGPESRVLQFAPAVFDASVSEWATALLSGAALVVAGKPELLPGGSLEETVERLGVTVATLPPSVLSRVRPGALAGLRTLVSAGEACGAPLAERWRQGRRMLNAYGPTEATVCASMGDLTGGPVSIGRPIVNGRVYVLDGELEPVPVGAAGELWVGGVGVARGYAGRPELTAERFVPDPFGGVPGARLYRTGDRGRWRATRDLEFLGRADGQVKIRGHRIEPGEVEAALLEHPGVRQAAVVAREDGSGEKRLVAYLVGTVEAEEVRRHLRERLPEVMVPAAVVALEALPLTVSGKLDRRALPAPEAVVGEARERRAPRTTVEELLAGVWAEVLGGEVGLDDDFFALGGHSLLATQVVSRVREVLGVELELRLLFGGKTLEALAREVEELRGGGAPLVRIERLPRQGPAPLSYAQQRLWFLDQLQPGSRAFHVPAAVRLRGRLAAGALARGLDEVGRRHAVLRTRFVEEGGAVAQRVEEPRPGRLAVLDLGGLPEAAREAEVSALAREEARRPFDLTCGPLMRALLLRLDAEDHVLLLTLHHIVSDGWSVGILIRESALLYEAFHEGKPSPLPELDLQYSDYAVWQREWLAGGEMERQLAYWRERLRDLPVLELPLDRPRPAVLSDRGARERIRLDAALAAGLSGLCRREGVTLFMALAAAWSAVLWRWSGQRDFPLGTPVANRNRRELEPLIGFFVNTVVLRMEVVPEGTFRELLGGARERALEAYAHQDAPFEQVVEAVAPKRDLSRSPLFQVTLTLQNAPVSDARLPGLTLSGMELEPGAAQYELSLILQEAPGDGIGGLALYSTDLFTASTVRRLLDQLGRVLAQAVKEPGQPVEEMGFLGEEERRQVLVDWNDTARPYPRRGVHELFAEQARMRPDALAIVMSGGGELTYGELDRRADQLGRYLATLGVGPEMCVALCLERSLEMVVAILGILKAGGAYVPLDPAYPMERLAWMLEDAAAPVVLTREALLDRLPVTWAQVICLDRDGDDIGRQDGRPVLESAAGADNLAYVMYTSGSTGQPRGVAVHHGAVVRLVRGSDYCALDAGETLLHMAPASFDASVFELWGALLNGGRCVLAPPGAVTGPELSDLVRRHGVTTAWLTSSLFNVYVDEAPGVVAGLRQLLVGGDAVSVAHVRRAAAVMAGGARIINGYGPTEATTFTACHAVAAREARSLDLLPIGRPIANARVYVLDTGLRPVPVGVPGELWAGGEGLARGYVNQPALTAERFAPDPFADVDRAGGRLYRTGDRVRWRPDGTLELLGRFDDQVKIRGYRIEPGEVRAALESHPDVEQAAVVVREDSPGQKRLVAYVVGRGGPAAVDVEALRGGLRRKLPEHLVPAILVPLDALPITANGKLDRGALPVPAAAATGPALAPRDTVEARLLRLWGRTLGVRDVGISDSFFALGGDSLTAVALAHAITREFAVPFSVMAVFLHGTVEEQAACLRGAGGAVEPQLVLLHDGDGPETVVFIHPGGGTVLAYLELARQLRGFRVYAIQSEALVTGETALTTVEAMAERYCSLVAALPPAGPCFFGGWSSGGLVAFEMARRWSACARPAPVLLFDTYLPAPGAVETLAEVPDAALVHEMLQRPPWLDRDRMETLAGDDLLAYCLGRAEEAGALAPGYDLARARRHLAAVRTNLEASARYRPQTYPGGVVLFRAEGDPESGETLGWERLARDLTVVPVRGVHSQILGPDNLERLRCAIEAAVRAQEETAQP